MTCHHCDRGTQHLPWPQEWLDLNHALAGIIARDHSTCTFYCSACFSFDCASCGHPVAEHARPPYAGDPAPGGRAFGRCAWCNPTTGECR